MVSKGNMENEKIISGNDVKVMFTYTRTAKQTEFSVNKDTRFGDVVREAYKQFDEKKKQTDTIFCANGTSLDNYLDKTIYDIVSNICKSANFDIKGDSGGAAYFFYFRP